VPRNVSGAFEDAKRADGAVGALRTARFKPSQISVVSADYPAPDSGHGDDRGEGGLRPWLVTHLTRRGAPQEHAERYHQIVIEGRVLVSVAIESDEQAEEARNLLVSAGADEISREADGPMMSLHPTGTSA
jgi:hypothetical protein